MSRIFNIAALMRFFKALFFTAFLRVVMMTVTPRSYNQSIWDSYWGVDGGISLRLDIPLDTLYVPMAAVARRIRSLQVRFRSSFSLSTMRARDKRVSQNSEVR